MAKTGLSPELLLVLVVACALVAPSHQRTCPKFAGRTYSGECVCVKGTALDFDKTRCMECPAPQFRVGTDERCYCGTGYEGRTIFINDKLTGCKKCPAGFTTQVTNNLDNACVCKDPRKGAVADPKTSSPSKCVCRWGFAPAGAKNETCRYAGLCASKAVKMDFWYPPNFPNGTNGATFPTAVLKTKPSWSTAGRLGKDGSIVWPTNWPKDRDAELGYRIAARFTLCKCLKHKDWDTQFNYTLQANGLFDSSVKIIIDGGERVRGRGDYYDQNIRSRPGKRPLLPVQSGWLTKNGSAVTLTAPQYEDTMGGFLSGMDSIPNIKNYEACHKIEILYSAANIKIAQLVLQLPK